ncbi:hypothetical protein [Nocardia tengchongensis]|uniref:hypothetical protein n=1 Tax=Nocardia tengchongensis TaxID=2055889 RepID=UPI00368BDFCF
MDHLPVSAARQRSRTVWENIAFANPYSEDVNRIKIVSLPFYAESARHYLAQQRPDLAQRLVRGADYRFGEWMPLKPLLALYALRQRGMHPEARPSQE